MKTGLVLEGGGMRGIYTAGVLDVFGENGISFDGVIGVSAGAIHGCSYLSGQFGRSIRYYKKYCGDPRFMGWKCYLKTGDFVGADFCYHELPEKLDVYDNEAFKSCGVPFYVVCTNVETGKAEYIRMEDMNAQIDYLRASASLPFFSRIVEVGGKKLLDGGCSDSVPVEAFQKIGYGKNVVILTRPADYRKKPELRFLSPFVYRQYPAFAEALKNRPNSYNQTAAKIKMMERSGSVFVIRPTKDLDIGRLEKTPEKVEEIYETGRVDALKVLSELRLWMQK